MIPANTQSIGKWSTQKISKDFGGNLYKNNLANNHTITINFISQFISIIIRNRIDPLEPLHTTTKDLLSCML